MTLQTIKFEYDIPDGYSFVRYGKYISGELYINSSGNIDQALSDGVSEWIIVEESEQQKRKHADLIYSWADGAKIQAYYNGKWEDVGDPSFSDHIKFRIKPKTKTVRFRNYVDSKNNVAVTYTGSTETYNYFGKWLGDWQEVEIEE